MSLTLTINAAFGSSRTGLVGRVAYSLDGGTTWVTSGITEPVTGSGNYQASVTVTPPLVVNWKTGDGDRVSTILTLTAAGTGYTNGTGYALTFTGGGGSGVAGTFDVVSGNVTNLVLTNQGSGYTAAPSISFTGAGSGTGAAATASLVTQRYASESISQQLLAPAGLDSVTVETGINARQMLSLHGAFAAGVLSGATANATTQNIALQAAGNASTNRVIATTDENGNRTIVQLNLPA